MEFSPFILSSRGGLSDSALAILQSFSVAAKQQARSDHWVARNFVPYWLARISVVVQRTNFGGVSLGRGHFSSISAQCDEDNSGFPFAPNDVWSGDFQWDGDYYMDLVIKAVKGDVVHAEWHQFVPGKNQTWNVVGWKISGTYKANKLVLHEGPWFSDHPDGWTTCGLEGTLSHQENELSGNLLCDNAGNGVFAVRRRNDPFHVGDVWKGYYMWDTIKWTFEMVIVAVTEGSVTAEWRDHSDGDTVVHTLVGSYVAEAKKITFSPGQWLSPHPPHWVLCGLEGHLTPTPEGVVFAGSVEADVDSAGLFELKRSREHSTGAQGVATPAKPSLGHGASTQSNPGSTSSKPGSTTSKSRSTSSKSGSTSSKAGSTSSKSGSTSSKSGSTSQHGSGTAKPGSDTSTSSSSASKPGSTTSKSGSGTSTSGSGTSKSGSRTAHHGSGTPKSGGRTAQPGSGTSQSGSTTSKSGSTSSKSGSTTSNSGSTIPKSGRGTSKSGSGISKSGSATRSKSGKTSSKPGNPSSNPRVTSTTHASSKTRQTAGAATTKSGNTGLLTKVLSKDIKSYVIAAFKQYILANSVARGSASGTSAADMKKLAAIINGIIATIRPLIQRAVVAPPLSTSARNEPTSSPPSSPSPPAPSASASGTTNSKAGTNSGSNPPSNPGNTVGRPSKPNKGSKAAQLTVSEFNSALRTLAQNREYFAAHHPALYQVIEKHLFHFSTDLKSPSRVIVELTDEVRKDIKNALVTFFHNRNGH